MSHAIQAEAMLREICVQAKKTDAEIAAVLDAFNRGAAARVTAKQAAARLGVSRTTFFSRYAPQMERIHENSKAVFYLSADIDALVHREQHTQFGAGNVATSNRPPERSTAPFSGDGNVQSS